MQVCRAELLITVQLGPGNCLHLDQFEAPYTPFLPVAFIPCQCLLSFLEGLCGWKGEVQDADRRTRCWVQEKGFHGQGSIF